MTTKEMKEELKKSLSKKRYIHTLGVVKSARELASQYGADKEKAALAALLHDCAKELKLADMQQLVRVHEQAVDEDMFHNGALLHGLAGMILAKEKYGITDPDVLEAIRVHTTGKEHMSILDKVVFLADYIEENRDFPGVEELREASSIDLDRAVLLGYDNTIHFLLASEDTIYTPSIIGRNDIIKKIKASNKGGVR